MKAFVWDLSGVLTKEKEICTYKFAESCGLERKIWRVIDDDLLIKNGRWCALERGEITLQQFSEELSHAINAAGGECSLDKAATIWGCPNPFEYGGGIFSKMLEYLINLNGSGINYLATNNIKEWRKIWSELVPIEKFQYVFDSSEMGFRKPEDRFWEAVESEIFKMRIVKENIVLIDNSEVNCKSAINRGWKAVHFKCEDEAIKLLNKQMGER